MTPAAHPGERIGLFEAHGDLGAARRPGAAAYDAESQVYTVTGAEGAAADGPGAGHFVWRPMRGDLLLRARVEGAGGGAEPRGARGWSVRQGLDPDAPHVTAVVHGDGRTTLRVRRVAGGATEEMAAPLAHADVLQLERRGDRFVLAAARFGEALVEATPVELPLGDAVYAGLLVEAHGSDAVTARFDQVRVVVPAREGFVPYRDYLGANLEILDVHGGGRTVVHRSAGALQAPNWTPDGSALVYNEDGRMYRFDLATRTPVLLDTGFATRNNNDHVLSPDGTLLGISHHSEEDDGQSIVYVLPAGGGTPRRITARGPSYLHGWSPDGERLVFTGGRGGTFDIYDIPASGGEERRLTRSAGLDDGPDYTPDGRWIVFGSSRAGRMQIWRMRPDGSGEEQVTDDGFNNWFPHPSPDGRWIVFLSYGPEVHPEDHPWYRQVYLRLMPMDGGAPRIVAYVYGGQGTINVPSWSPDSRRVAFVSNTA